MKKETWIGKPKEVMIAPVKIVKAGAKILIGLALLGAVLKIIKK